MFGASHEMAGHLVRRGLQASTEFTATIYDQGEQHEIRAKISNFGIMVFALTIGVSILMLVSIRYTLWGIVSTLAMVEEPRTTVLAREEKSSSSDALAEERIDSDVVVVKEKPITDNIRQTIRYLRTRAGWRARWRGLGAFLVFSLGHSFVSNLFGNILSTTYRGPMGLFQTESTSSLSGFLTKSFGSLIATVFFARFLAAWVHIVISEPSQKYWYQRIPPVSTWKHLTLPSVAADLATRLAFILPALCFFAFGLHETNINVEPVISIVLKAVVCFAVSIITFFALTLPACVTLVRVQASLLPDDAEAIVNFDRTFGGKVVPPILGGSGALNYRDAWKSFDRPARARIIKLFLKFVGIEVALHLLFVFVIAVEGMLLIGPKTIGEFIHDKVL